MELKTVYLVDYDVLRNMKYSLNGGLYGNIPGCFEEKKYFNYEVESIPKEKEVILVRNAKSLRAVSVFKVVYYEWKTFVIYQDINDELPAVNESKAMRQNLSVVS